MYTYISRSLGGRLGFLSAWIFLIAQPPGGFTRSWGISESLP
jgi:amino acid transporter